MSLRDEVRASLRTPQQVENEIPNADKYTIRRDAKDDFEKMKSALKSQAEAGKYRDYGSYKLVEGEIISGLARYVDMRRTPGSEKQGGFRSRTHYYVDVNCTYKSKNHAEFYLKELDALTKEEGIEYQLIAIYDDKMNKREYRWPIPGSMRIENVINVVAGIYIHLKVSMKI